MTYRRQWLQLFLTASIYTRAHFVGSWLFNMQMMTFSAILFIFIANRACCHATFIMHSIFALHIAFHVVPLKKKIIFRYCVNNIVWRWWKGRFKWTCIMYVCDEHKWEKHRERHTKNEDEYWFFMLLDVSSFRVFWYLTHTCLWLYE